MKPERAGDLPGQAPVRGHDDVRRPARYIVQLAGSYAQFALDNEGTIWMWTPSGWEVAERTPLPQPVTPEPPRRGRPPKAQNGR